MRLFFLLLSIFFTQAFSKTYVCFPFFNELDILEIHLEELYDHVDHFVIVESCETFMGQKKPFYLKENKERFARFWDKIIPITLTERQKTDNPWDREHFQRNQVLRGLKKCTPNDLILLCDCDEIVSQESLKKAKQLVDKQSLVLFKQKFYIYYLNTQATYLCTAPLLIYYDTFKRVRPADVRRARGAETNLGIAKYLSHHNIHCKTIEGGWHFTSMGGPDTVQKKISSWSHAVDTEMKAFLANFPEKFRESLAELDRVEIDETYPKYIQENLDLMRERGLILD